jgi:cation diffusion facilitator CzcD-associated flavoprotein CzcO/amino acid transporter
MDDALRIAARKFETGKRRKFLSTQKIVFLVVAAAAPLAAMVGNLPIALSRGLGAATPAAFLFAGLTLLCFSVGYAAISRRVVSTGAFYTYVAKGLGKPIGVSAAFTAMIAYVGYTVGLAAFLGYFADLIMSAAGVHVSWLIYALGGIAIVAVLGYRSIDLSSKVLGVLMAAEVGVLALFDLAVIAAKGWSAFPLEAFSPAAIAGPGLGIGLMITFTSFIGFESAALYGEEAEAPTRSIPLATYSSVILIAIFYLLTAWLTVGAVGATHAAQAATAEGGSFMINLTGRFAGEGVMAAMGILVCTSLLASYLALHNAAARYMFALSREKMLPKLLGKFHPERYAPSNASAAVSLITLAGVGAFGLTRLDPYLTLVPALIGLGTFGIILIQAMAAIAIFSYLWRRRSSGSAKVLAAAGAGAVGLVIAAILVAQNFSILAATGLAWTAGLPWLYGLTGLFGLGFAVWMRRFRAKDYSVLAESHQRPDSQRQIPKVKFDGRYCIVGGGPCGLLAARAFTLAGVPYDQFERHTDVGGIWDIDNPGSSMYESAHFISSKYTSNFFGAPMPDDFPDYPDYRQILSYVRDFAKTFGLTDKITFGVEVVNASPIGPGAEGGWRVELSNGETRTYQGLVVANGVTWHPSLPDYPGLETFKGEVRHAVTYRDAREFDGKRVLIVGAGNSGVDIACDAARHATSAMISLRRGYHFVPKHVFGVPTDVFLAGRVHPPKGVVIPDDPDKMLHAIVGDLTRYGLQAPDHKAMQSHPIMNSQILHYLAHGDLKAQVDVERFTETGVVFKDGSSAQLDMVLFATGYEYRMPFLDESLFDWKQGRPQLYLNIFHRKLKGLSVVGYIEFASAGYQRFDEMAQMAAMDAVLEQSGRASAEGWSRMKAEDRPDLRGASTYVDSPRHANYVDVAVYRRVLAEIRETFGWPDPSDELYQPPV